jgi:hypothetical protein
VIDHRAATVPVISPVLMVQTPSRSMMPIRRPGLVAVLITPPPLDNRREARQVARMEKDNLPGLSPLWLISLAMVLGTVIVVLIPASIATGDQIKSSDWLGFAGNVIAGVMTIVAAAVAWRAVQNQIGEQRRIASQQSALQALEPLHRHAAVLEDECRLALSLGELARKTAIIDEYRKTGEVNLVSCRVLFPIYQQIQEELTRVHLDWRVSNSRFAYFSGAGLQRLELEGSVVAIEARLITAMPTLESFAARDLSAVVWNDKDKARVDAITFGVLSEECQLARKNFTDVIIADLRKVHQQIKKAKQQAGI